LNFGNPERPEIMWQFAKAVEGIGAACRALAVPITGGNVSLYNETDGQAIYPTPVIGVVGLLEHADHVVGRRFQSPGDVIVALGTNRGELGGSEYLKMAHRLVRGVPPSIDLEAERALQTLLVELADQRLVRSAHVCSDGGLAVTLAECCFDTGGVGAEVAVDAIARSGLDLVDRRGTLWRVRVAGRSLHEEEQLPALLEHAAAAGVPGGPSAGPVAIG
jgi:phosphoribosylformylglycinamidine synthase